MKEYILWLLFGDKRRSLLFLNAILADYFIFNLTF